MPKETKQITIQMDTEAPIPPTFYSNYMAVNHGKFEFTLYFCQARIPPFADLKKLEEIKAKPVCTIDVPSDLMPSIIEALQTNWNKYKEAYSKKIPVGD